MLSFFGVLRLGFETTGSGALSSCCASSSGEPSSAPSLSISSSSPSPSTCSTAFRQRVFQALMVAPLPLPRKAGRPGGCDEIIRVERELTQSINEKMTGIVHNNIPSFFLHSAKCSAMSRVGVSMNSSAVAILICFKKARAGSLNTSRGFSTASIFTLAVLPRPTFRLLRSFWLLTDPLSADRFLARSERDKAVFFFAGDWKMTSSNSRLLPSLRLFCGGFFSVPLGDEVFVFS